MVSSVDVDSSLATSSQQAAKEVVISRPVTTDDHVRPGSTQRKLSWTGEDEHLSESGDSQTGPGFEPVFLTEDSKVGLQLSSRALKKVPEKSSYLQSDQGRKKLPEII